MGRRKSRAEPRRVGIYIHIPFCASRCAYCDFCSVAGEDGRMDRYQQALLRHIAEFAPRLEGMLVDSVYFGGGTPSYYGARRLVELFDALKQQYSVLKASEVTVEMNPDSMDGKSLELLRRAGVNRLSIGVQSANNSILRFIGRRHSFEQAQAAFALARSCGFDNLSADLIYGLPAQTREDWAESLAALLALEPAHLSCYGLKLEPGTPLFAYRDSPLIPDDDTQADMYLYTVDTLRDHGYFQYEISNFAQRGRQSRHNLKYWQLDDYAGFGASAASALGMRRYTYLRDVARYTEAVLDGGPLVAEMETVTPFERAAEYVMLGMRTTRGICAAEYNAIFSADFAPLEALLHSYMHLGLARRIDTRYSFTPQGFLLSNRLIGELLDAQAEQRQHLSESWREAERYPATF